MTKKKGKGISRMPEFDPEEIAHKFSMQFGGTWKLEGDQFIQVSEKTPKFKSSIKTRWGPLRLDAVGPCPDDIKERTLQGLKNRSALQFCAVANNQTVSAFVFDNERVLKARSIYEEAVVHAYIMGRLNHLGNEYLFDMANLERIRTAGESVPGQSPYRVYRGVCGIGRARRVRGFSWTGTVELAAWFALRGKRPDPAVFEIKAPDEWVLCYLHEKKGRGEDEYILRLPPGKRPRRVDIPKRKLVKLARVYEEKKNKRQH